MRMGQSRDEQRELALLQQGLQRAKRGWGRSAQEARVRGLGMILTALAIGSLSALGTMSLLLLGAEPAIVIICGTVFTVLGLYAFLAYTLSGSTLLLWWFRHRHQEGITLRVDGVVLEQWPLISNPFNRGLTVILVQQSNGDYQVCSIGDALLQAIPEPGKEVVIEYNSSTGVVVKAH